MCRPGRWGSPGSSPASTRVRRLAAGSSSEERTRPCGTRRQPSRRFSCPGEWFGSGRHRDRAQGAGRGPLTTVQDLGRPGHAAIGVSGSGALDRGSLRLANRLVGNPEGDSRTGDHRRRLLGGVRDGCLDRRHRGVGSGERGRAADRPESSGGGCGRERASRSGLRTLA